MYLILISFGKGLRHIKQNPTYNKNLTCATVSRGTAQQYKGCTFGTFRSLCIIVVQHLRGPIGLDILANLQESFKGGKGFSQKTGGAATYRICSVDLSFVHVSLRRDLHLKTVYIRSYFFFE